MPVPNILLVVADDFGIDQCDVYGLPGGRGITTEIDGLKTNGTVFRWAYAHPNCSITRCCLLLQRAPGRTGAVTSTLSPGQLNAYGVLEWEPPGSEVFLAATLRAAGYATSQVGKWHIHHPSAFNDWDYIRTKAGYDWAGGMPWNAEPTANGGGATPSASSYIRNSAVNGANGHYRIVNGVINNAGAPAPGSLTSAPGQNDYCATYITTREIDDAIARVGAMAQPWFLHLGLHAPHVPIVAPPAALHTQVLGNYPTPFPPNTALNGAPIEPGQFFAELYGVDPTRAIKPWYRATVEATSNELGRLFAALPNNTIIVFVGDNGTGHSAGSDTTNIEGSWDHTRCKNTMYEGGIRVPLIVSQTAGTGIITSTNTENATALVSMADIHATICEIAGATAPNIERDGISFLSALQGGTHSRAEIISQYSTPLSDPATWSSSTPWTQRWYAIRLRNGYKVHRRITNNPGTEAYRICDDAGAPVDQYELTDIKGSATRSDAFYIKQANKQLDSFITEVEGLPVG